MFVQFEKPMLTMTKLRDSVKELDFKTSQDYFSTLEMIFGLISGILKDIEYKLDNLFANRNPEKYQQLSKQLTLLLEAKWVDQLKPGTCNIVLEEAKMKIL
jgi:hypothetical protein